MKPVLATTAIAAAMALSPAFAQEADQQPSPPLSIPERTTTVTTIEAPPESARPLVNIASVNVPLPQEVATVAQNGKYSTKDLVKAQLMAMNNAPPIQQPVINTTTITYPNDAATPDAPSTAGQADQARTAEGTSGHSGDTASPPSTGSSTPG